MGIFGKLKKKILEGASDINKKIASFERKTGIDIPYVGTDLEREKKEKERNKALEKWAKSSKATAEDVRKAVEMAAKMAEENSKIITKGGFKAREKILENKKNATAEDVKSAVEFANKAIESDIKYSPQEKLQSTNTPVAISPVEKEYYESSGHSVVDFSKSNAKPKYGEIKANKKEFVISIPTKEGISEDTYKFFENQAKEYEKQGFRVEKTIDMKGNIIYKVKPPVKTYKTEMEVYPDKVVERIVDADTGEVIKENVYTPPPGAYYDVATINEQLKQEYGKGLENNKITLTQKIEQEFEVKSPINKKFEIEKPSTLPVGLAYGKIGEENLKQLSTWERVAVKEGLTKEELERAKQLWRNPANKGAAAMATFGKTALGVEAAFNYIVKTIAGLKEGKSLKEASEEASVEAFEEPVIETAAKLSKTQPKILGGKASTKTAIKTLAMETGEATGKAFVYYALPELATEPGVIGKISTAALRGLQAYSVAEAIRNPTPENITTAALVIVPEVVIRAISPLASRIGKSRAKGTNLEIKDVKFKVKAKVAKVLRAKKGTNEYIRIGEVEMYTKDGKVIKAHLLAKSKVKGGKIAQDLMVEIPQQSMYIKGKKYTIPYKRVRIKSVDLMNYVGKAINRKGKGGIKIGYKEGVKLTPEKIREVEIIKGKGEELKIIRNKKSIEKSAYKELSASNKGVSYTQRLKGIISKEVSSTTSLPKKGYVVERSLSSKKGAVISGKRYTAEKSLVDKFLVFEKEISPSKINKAIGFRGKGSPTKPTDFFKLETGKAPAIVEGKQQYISPSEFLKLSKVKQPPASKTIPGLKAIEAGERTIFTRNIARLLGTFSEIKAKAPAPGKPPSIGTGNIGRIVPFFPGSIMARLKRFRFEKKKNKYVPHVVAKLPVELKVRAKRMTFTKFKPTQKEVNIPKQKPISKPEELTINAETTKLTTIQTTKSTTKMETATSLIQPSLSISPRNLSISKNKIRLGGLLKPPTQVRFGKSAKSRLSAGVVKRKLPSIVELLMMPSLGVEERKVPYLSPTTIRKTKLNKPQPKPQSKPNKLLSATDKFINISSLSVGEEIKSKTNNKKKEVKINKKRAKRIGPSYLLKVG